jgi:hypothetical protein
MTDVVVTELVMLGALLVMLARLLSKPTYADGWT